MKKIIPIGGLMASVILLSGCSGLLDVSQRVDKEGTCGRCEEKKLAELPMVVTTPPPMVIEPVYQPPVPVKAPEPVRVVPVIRPPAPKPVSKPVPKPAPKPVPPPKPVNRYLHKHGPIPGCTDSVIHDHAYTSLKHRHDFSCRQAAPVRQPVQQPKPAPAPVRVVIPKVKAKGIYRGPVHIDPAIRQNYYWQSQ